jgi:fatty-acyl-CoA synthase
MKPDAARGLSYRHEGGDAPLIGVPLHRFLAGVADRHPTRDAVVSLPQGTRLDYRSLLAGADTLARGLLALGVGRGTRVGVWATDNVEWILLQLGTARVGAVLVNVNPAYRPRELVHALRAARVQALFVMPAFRRSNYVEMLMETCPELASRHRMALRTKAFPDLRHVVAFDPRPDREARRPAPGFHTWEEVLALADGSDPDLLDRHGAALDADDPINIQFTSGTTGAPKPVVLTHHNILNNGYFIGRLLDFTAEDRLCVPVPFYHCFGMVVSNLACLTHGAAIVIPAPHFEAGATLAAIERERCTAVHGVPPMFIDELERPDFREYDLSSLRTGIMAGAPCPPVLMRRVIEEMGCRDLRIGYGQTEASPVTHMTRATDAVERRLRTVGTNLPHQEAKVVDPETGAMVPTGTVGEVCFRGYHVMRGYFEQPDATRKAVDEAGWLHSGDLGLMEEDGCLRITGRLKDMIIRGGENVYPAEIEAVLLEHPAVAQAAVVGVPDERLGEEIVAWVRLHAGARAGEEAIRAFARERLAHFQVPREIRVVDAFPLTVTGKVQKFRIREALAAEPR